MRVWVGDETGLVKEVGLEQKKLLSKHRQQDRKRGVLRLCFAAPASAPEALLACATTDGVVELRPTAGDDAGQLVASLRVHRDDADASQIKAAPVVALYAATVGDRHSVLTLTKKGQVSAHAIPPAALAPAAGDVEPPAFTGTTLVEAGASDAMAIHTSDGGRLTQLATGGPKNDLKIWDVNNLKAPIFKAKNLKNDNVDLERPVHVTATRFVSDTTIAVTTAFGEFRMYDTRTKRRPVFDVKFDDFPLRALAVQCDGQAIICGNTRGTMKQMDIRTGRVVGGYSGHAGAIRDIVIHKTLPYVLSVGLDRFIRVHHLHRHKQDHKIYVKQRLTTCLFTGDDIEVVVQPKDTQKDDTTKGAGDKRPHPPSGSEDSSDDSDADDGNGNADRTWDALERKTISQNKKRRKNE